MKKINRKAEKYEKAKGSIPLILSIIGAIILVALLLRSSYLKSPKSLDGILNIDMSNSKSDTSLPDKVVTQTFADSTYFDPQEQTEKPVDLSVTSVSNDSSEKQQGYTYTVSENHFETDFKDNAVSENFVRITKVDATSINAQDIKEYQIAYTIEENPDFGKPNIGGITTSENTQTYKEVFPNIDLKMTVSTNNLLEEFVVKDKETALKITKIPESFETKDLIFKVRDDGSIDFLDSNTNTLIFKIPKPVMYEVDGDSKNYGLHYEIKQDRDKVYLTKVLDEEGKNWIKDTNRQYPIVIDATTISTTTDITTTHLFKRTTWYDGTRYWSTVNSGAAVTFWYSTDGTSWTKNNNATLSIDSAMYFDIDADSSNAFITYAATIGRAEARQATSYPNENFGWSSAQIVNSCSRSCARYVSSLERDSSGYLWTTVLNYYPGYFCSTVAFKSSSPNSTIGTWSSAYTLDTIDSVDCDSGSQIVSAGSQNMYVISRISETVNGGETLKGVKWVNSSSSWVSELISSSVAENDIYSFSVVSDSSSQVHLIYLDSTTGGLSYRKYTTSWQDSISLDTTAGCSHPSLSLDPNNNALYAFWTRGGTVYYKKGVSPYASGNWDSEATTLYSTGTNLYPSAAYQANTDKVFLEWVNGTGSPYNVMWDSITATSDTSPTPTSSASFKNLKMKNVKIY